MAAAPPTLHGLLGFPPARSTPSVSAASPAPGNPIAPSRAPGRGATEGERVGITHAQAHHAKVPIYETFVSRLPVSFDEGSLVVVALGTVDLRIKYHSYKYIWPVGFSSRRRFHSLRAPGTTSTYLCNILDGGATGPHFTVHEEGADSPAGVGHTATVACTAVFEALQAAGTVIAPKPSGPEFFGFGLPAVQAAIEGAPQASLCTKYFFTAQLAAGAIVPTTDPPPLQQQPATSPPSQAAPIAAPSSASLVFPPHAGSGLLPDLPEPELSSSGRKKVRKIPGSFPVGAAGVPQSQSPGAAPSGGGAAGSGGARIDVLPEYSLQRLHRSLTAAGATLPPAVRRAIVIEAALWAGRLPPASLPEPLHASVVQPQPGPRPLGSAAPGAPHSDLAAQQQPLCPWVPTAVAADIVAAWEFLRAAAQPLGLDAVLAQLERLSANASAESSRPLTLLSPVQLVRALALYGAPPAPAAPSAAAPAAQQREQRWLDDALVTAVHTCLVRAALAELPALLAVPAKDLHPDLPRILRESYVDRVDGDTWAEGARILLTAVAQHRTASALAKYGAEAYEPSATDDGGVNGDAVGNREDVSWVHLHSGRHVLGWFAASASPRLTGATPALPELMLGPAAAAAAVAVPAAAAGAGAAAAAGAALPLLPAKVAKGRMLGDAAVPVAVRIHAPDLLYRVVDAYEYARQVREKDTYAHTFPPVSSQGTAAAAAAAAGGAAPQAGGPDALLGAVLRATAAQARALVGPAHADLLVPLGQPGLSDWVVQATAVRQGLLGDKVGRGAAYAPAPPLTLQQSLGMYVGDDGAPPQQRLAFPPPPPLADVMASLLGVGTGDGGLDHAYIYGCILEAERAVEAGVRAEQRALRAAAASSSQQQQQQRPPDDAEEEEDENEEVLLDDDEEAAGAEGRAAAAAAGGAGGGPGKPSSSTPLRRLLAVLRTMINVEFLRAEEDELQAASKPIAATANRFKKSLNMRRPNELERLRRRREHLLRMSLAEPLVLTAGRLREAALFAYRRFLVESGAEAGAGLPPAAFAHGGTVGPWVLPPAAEFPAAVAAAHGPALAALEELRLCEGVRRAVAAMPECAAFVAPLDVDAAGVPEYFKVVTVPNDMRTVGQRLSSAAAHLLQVINGGEDAPPPPAAAAASSGPQSSLTPACVLIDAKTLPVLPWRLVSDRWASYNAGQCRDDMLQTFLNAQRFNAPSSELHVLAEKCRARTMELFAAVVIDRSMTVADPPPFGGAPAAPHPPTAVLSRQPSGPRTLPAAAEDDHAVSSPEDVDWYLSWPAVRRTLARNKYFRKLAESVMPTLYRLQTHLVDAHPPSAGRGGGSGGRQGGGGAGARKAVSEVVEDWAAAPAPAPFGDGRGCRACGREDLLETEAHLETFELPPEGGVLTLVICDSCESEYHPMCLQPPVFIGPEELWVCPECLLSGRQATAAGQQDTQAAGSRGGGRGRGRGRGGHGAAGASGASPSKGKGRGGAPAAVAMHFMDPIDGTPYAPQPEAVAAVGSALSGPVRTALATHGAAALEGEKPRRALAPAAAASAHPGGPSYSAHAAAEGGSEGGAQAEETAPPPEQPVHALTSDLGSEPPAFEGQIGPVSTRVALRDLGALGRFMQPSAAQVIGAAEAGAPPPLQTNGFGTQPVLRAPFPGAAMAAAAPTPVPVTKPGAPVQRKPGETAAGSAVVSRAAAPPPAKAAAPPAAAAAAPPQPAAPATPSPAPIDLDAPPGLGGSPIEGSTCLAVCPPEARALWRLAALLATHDPRQLPPAVRARLLRELVMIVADVGHVAAHLETLAEAFVRARRELKRITVELRPPETRAAALARCGVPMVIVARARREELRRVRFAGGAGWLAVRPPPYVREIARLLCSPSAARTLTVATVDLHAVNWARGEISADERQATKAGAKRAAEGGAAAAGGGAQGGRDRELLQRLERRGFIRRVCFGRVNPSAGAHPAAAAATRLQHADATAEGLSAAPRVLNTFAKFAVAAPRPRASVARRAPATPSGPAASELTGPWAHLPGPFTHATQPAIRALMACVGAMPRPSNEAELPPLQMPSQSAIDAARGKLYIATQLRGVSLCALSAGSKDGGPKAGMGGAGGSVVCQARIQLTGSTRSVFFHVDQVLCARAYDLCALATRGAAAAKTINFPGDIELYVETLREWESSQSPAALGLDREAAWGDGSEAAAALPTDEGGEGAAAAGPGEPDAGVGTPEGGGVPSPAPSAGGGALGSARATRGVPYLGRFDGGDGGARAVLSPASSGRIGGLRALPDAAALLQRLPAPSRARFEMLERGLRAAMDSKPAAFAQWETADVGAEPAAAAAAAVEAPWGGAEEEEEGEARLAGQKRLRDPAGDEQGAAGPHAAEDAADDALGPQASVDELPAAPAAEEEGGEDAGSGLLLPVQKRPRLDVPVEGGVDAPSQAAAQPQAGEGAPLTDAAAAAAAAATVRAALSSPPPPPPADSGDREPPVPTTAPVTALFPAELAFGPQDLFPWAGVGAGRLGVELPPAGAAGAADVDLSRPEGEMRMVGPEEPDAGHPAADRALLQVERGVLLQGAAELAWREAARSAYAPKWSAEECESLAQGVIEAYRDDPGIVEDGGVIAPRVWLSILCRLPFHPARCGHELREFYHLLRALNANKWRDYITAWASRARRSTTDALALARAMPCRPLTTADRTAEDARLLERSRASLDWDAHVGAAELVLAGLGGRALPLGEDRWGQAYFALGAHSPHVFVVGPNPLLDAAPRSGGGGGAAAVAAAAPAPSVGPRSGGSVVGGTPAQSLGARPFFDPRRRGTLGPLAAGAPSAGAAAGSTNGPQIAAAKRAVVLRPGEWAVYDSPASLAALIRALYPLGKTEGPLRAALQRREPVLLAAMRAAEGPAPSAPAAAPAAAAPAAAAAGPVAEGPEPAPVESSCLFCDQAIPVPAPAPAAPPAPEEGGAAPPPPPPIRTLHCLVCHVSFPTGRHAAAASASLFAAHVQRCWAASVHTPVARAVAALCAAAAAQPQPQAGEAPAGPTAAEVAAAASAAGARASDVAASLDPTLKQLKRQALCLAEAVDWSRLRQPAVWPPGARAQWGHSVLTAPSGGELNRLLHALVRALQADDTAAQQAAIALAAPLQAREGQRKRTPGEVAALVAGAATGSADARPGSNKWRWVPDWFLDRMPNAEAVAGVRTAAAAAWTLRALAAMLRPNLLPRAAPPPLPTEVF